MPGRRRREGNGKKLDNNGKNRADSGHRLNFAYKPGKSKIRQICDSWKSWLHNAF
ncbi:hypothetical protein B4099_0513 [Heyndrickxia coagulans]|uniref:Uncharacterized protein n=1 Tax=Heyndrickxia coagulans TaxID=1398 RepID=A0A150K4S0_HEYCO|nr:hypothetical protein B4099_0513 [Heyndrickxia coagulans]